MKQVLVRNNSLQGPAFEPLLTPRMVENEQAQQSCQCRKADGMDYQEIPHAQTENAHHFEPLLTPRELENQGG